jgi:raffinose/stachyose/melibiose transport system permease protein
VRNRRRRAGGPKTIPWALALPGVALLLAFHFVAPLSGAWYSLTDWNGIASPRWVGLDNFRQIFTSSLTRDAFFHTLLLAATFLVSVNAIGLALALGLNRALKSRNILRSLFFLPAIVTPIATSYIWQYIFTYDGPLNHVLDAVGLGSWRRPWIGDPQWALWTVLVVLVWQYSGLAMVIFLAGLQAVPSELDEAAAVDGATTLFRLRTVTLPLLAPAVTISATLTMIIGLRVFDQVLALTGGGPVGASETLATQVWQQTFVFGKFGYGTALALVLAAVVGALALGQLAILRRRELQL